MGGEDRKSWARADAKRHELVGTMPPCSFGLKFKRGFAFHRDRIPCHNEMRGSRRDLSHRGTSESEPTFDHPRTGIEGTFHPLPRPRWGIRPHSFPSILSQSRAINQCWVRRAARPREFGHLQYRVPKAWEDRRARPNQARRTSAEH